MQGILVVFVLQRGYAVKAMLFLCYVKPFVMDEIFGYTFVFVVLTACGLPSA